MNLFNKTIVLVALIGIAAVMVAGCADQGTQTATKGKITGIEPGAGIMMMTEQAIEDYGLDFDLVASSSAGMASELTKAIGEEQWIVVTGWTPHWKFARYDLKYLDDPLGVYGGEEYIATLSRVGLADDSPDLYAVIERFYWTPDDMASVMLDVEGGMEPEDAAAKWIAANPETVSEWIGGVTSDGEKVTVGYVLWDSEIASTNVISQVLEQAGFDVEASAVDAGPLYQAVADGDVDFTVSSWLPATHKTYLDKYGDQIVMVGKNLEGAKVGLVVPTYVTIDSIDELNSVKEKFA